MTKMANERHIERKFWRGEPNTSTACTITSSIHIYLLLQVDQYLHRGKDSPPLLKGELEASIRSLKPDISPGVDNMTSELVKMEVKKLSRPLQLYARKFGNKRRADPVTGDTLTKKEESQAVPEWSAIQARSCSGLFLTVWNARLKNKSEEQAVFRAERGTVERIFNCRVFIEKHLQNQSNLFHIFIDFKKALIGQNIMASGTSSEDWISKGSYKSSKTSMTMRQARSSWATKWGFLPDNDSHQTWMPSLSNIFQPVSGDYYTGKPQWPQYFYLYR